MRNIILCLVVIALLQTAECSFHLCGLKLILTLRNLCNNKFCSGGFLVKPTANYTGSSSLSTPDYSKRAAPMYDSTVKRASIATECCAKRCNMAYLKSFCCNTNFPVEQEAPLTPQSNTTTTATPAHDIST